MAERIAQRFFADAGLDVEVTSAGTVSYTHLTLPTSGLV